MPAAEHLYVSPIGAFGKPHLEKILRRFDPAMFDFMLLVHDGTAFDEPLFERCTIVRDRGGMFELARRHVVPRLAQRYRYVWFWTDDLDIEQFDPGRYIEIVRRNHLAISQPALTPHSKVSHRITIAQPGLVGRLTDFCESTAGVYESQVWSRYWEILEPTGNRFGWGYDLLARGYCGVTGMGIIDSHPVTHLRLESTSSVEARREMIALLRKYPTVPLSKRLELGTLFE